MLQEISKKMYDPQKVVYPFDTITKVFNRLFEIKKDHNESLYDYTKRFKQARDNFMMILGTEVLYKYIEQTPEYIASKSSEKDKVKVQSMSMWMSYLYLTRADHNKYGSLLRGLQTQYSLGKNQYPSSVSVANDVLASHKWDDTFKVELKK